MFLFLFCLVQLSDVSFGQKLDRIERELAETMLKNVSDDVYKNYFDPTLHGLDWDSRVNEAKANIGNSRDMAEANAQIEGLFELLHDSHTAFIPPRNLITVDYGWRFKIIGNHTYVTEVRAGSDAEKKGVHPGDEVLTINGFRVDRASAPMLQYAMNVYVPRSSVDVTLREPEGKALDLRLIASLTKHSAVAGLGGSSWYSNEVRIRAEDARKEAQAEYMELSPDLAVIRIPAFSQIGYDVDDLFAKVRSHKMLIIDLRGCPGGTVPSLHAFLGHIFNHDVSVGKLVERGKVTPQTVRETKKNAFLGDLIVLVDSETASAGEIFARVVQLQERGTILGDHTSGRTMESIFMPHKTGINPVYYYGAFVTIADTVMADGKSLEHIGVEPDRTFLPTPADMSAHRDPVLSYAANLLGIQLTPENAAKLFARESP